MGNYSQYNVRSECTYGLVCATRMYFAVAERADSSDAHGKVGLITSKVVASQVA